jgi:serine phosphatase RsbU (regulator of sigma subunit)
MDAYTHWLLNKQKRWNHLHSIPFSQLATLLLAVFLLFSVVGFYIDLISGGRIPYTDLFVIAAMSGLNAALWVLVIARLPGIFYLLTIVVQFFLGRIGSLATNWIDHRFHPPLADPKQGINFAATCILAVVILSYFCFVRFMRVTGREAMRVKNELALAHGIQKTLVPPIQRRTAHFEIYGISEPSEKVGGDLVDVVELPNGDCIAYLADIAGHGLQAGILMGMLKTAARTALTDGNSANGEAALASLMERLNTVLPQVKEAHMYATFTALRLNNDGRAFYGMAASPPLLHWRADAHHMDRIEEQQFPLGLLAVSGFPAHPLAMNPGDILVIATDGILEVSAPRRLTDRRGAETAEFGIEALASLIPLHADRPLPEISSAILTAVRRFGKQFDDQTLLLVRRTS